VRRARSEVIKLSARCGIEALVNREAKRRTMRGFKVATAKLATPVRDALRRYTKLEAQRAKVPRRIPSVRSSSATSSSSPPSANTSPT
jgi:hypothetical protein